ncbi:MAG: 1-acyl-sn-glycerol-3-phosphate acyltransferase [Paludibacteraceae bacterium]
MNRFTFAAILRRLFHLHYSVHITGMQYMQDGRVHLVLPNHTAFIDPLILLSECGNVPLCPLVDERFFRNPLFRRVLAMADAVLVPDLEQTKQRVEGANIAAELSQKTIASLAAGKEIVFYPSGHVKTIDKEVIGNRRLAYEVCRQLPLDVEVILVNMRGLEQSRWSKLHPKTCVWRRDVYIQFEPMTEQVRTWAQTLDKRQFNTRLEDWYNTNLPL